MGYVTHLLCGAVVFVLGNAQMNYVTLRWGWSAGLSSAFFLLVGLGMAVYPRVLIPRFGEETCLVFGCAISVVNSVLVGLDPTGGRCLSGACKCIVVALIVH